MHPDPVALFGAVLMERLRAQGIAIEGGLRRERGVAPGTPLAELRSSLDAALIPINTYSRNSVADQLFLALGHAVKGAGTWAANAGELFLSSYSDEDVRRIVLLGGQSTDFHMELPFLRLRPMGFSAKPLDLCQGSDGSLYLSTFSGIYRVVSLR